MGTRVVFDDEGNTLPPLATLAYTNSGDGSVQLDKDIGMFDFIGSLRKLK